MTTTPAKNNALAFVGQIMTAYKAVMKAEGQALKYAIECGEALNRAKENVESTRPKGKWNAWLKDNCSEIQPRTERLYRQLASAVAEDPDIFAGCDSIRSFPSSGRNPSPEKYVSARKPISGVFRGLKPGFWLEQVIVFA
ncbi:MAG: hypothetical protein WAK55_10250 [Xanthobacteraceae bacterium]